MSRMSCASPAAMVNILITGTPGTGKTSLAQTIASLDSRLSHLNVSELVKTHNFHEGKDEEWDTYIIKEDPILDYIEEQIRNGGHFIVDHHSCDWFPERWFQLVVVLRCSNDVLYPRLESRGYSAKKIEENVSAEIFQVVLDEALDSYNPELVLELVSESSEDMDANATKVIQWFEEQIAK